MAFVKRFFDDLRNSATVDELVDQTAPQLLARSKLLEELAPIKTYNSWNFLGLMYEQQTPIASLVGIGQEIPSIGFGNLQKVVAETAKIAITRNYNEEIQRQLVEAMKLAQIQNIPIQNTYFADGTYTAGQDNDLAMVLFGSIKNQVRSVTDKLLLMTWQLIQTGRVDMEDDRTRHLLTIDFRDPESSALLFPSALTTTGNTSQGGALNRWSDYENANGLQNLDDMQEAYIQVNGFAPDYFIMSRKAFRHLKNQKSTKAAVTQVKGLPIGTVGDALLTQALEAMNLPTIQLVEDRFEIENEFKNVVQARFFNENTVALGKKEMAQRAIGPTIESVTSLVGEGNSFNIKPVPGIFVETYEKQKHPPIDSTTVVMSAIPICMRGKLLSARTID